MASAWGNRKRPSGNSDDNPVLDPKRSKMGEENVKLEELSEDDAVGTYEDEDDDSEPEDEDNSDSDADEEYKNGKKGKSPGKKVKVEDEGGLTEEQKTKLANLDLDKLYLKIMPMQVAKRVSLSLSDKINILERIKGGESQSSVASQLKLNRQTVQGIWSKREKIEKAARENDGDRKKCRQPNNLELERLIFAWVEDQQQKGMPPTGPQIRENARVLAKGLGLNDFVASAGWLDNFKQRNKVILPNSRKFLKNQKPRARKNDDHDLGALDHDDGHWNADEDLYFPDDQPIPVFKKSAPVSTKKSSASSLKKVPNEWISKTWSRISKGYSPSDIFFVDEFGMFYKTPPEKYKNYQGLSCFNGEHASERFSILFGTNSIGTERLKLVTVGSSPHPSSFGQSWNPTEQDKLPTEYWFHPNALISSEILGAWLTRLDKEMERVGRQVIIILTSSKLHQNVQENLESAWKFIKIAMLPSSFGSSALHQLESEIGYELKSSYKKMLLNKFVRNVEHGKESLKISVLDATGIVHVAWMGLDQSSISDVFLKTGLISEGMAGITTTRADKKKRMIEERAYAKSLVEMVKAAGVKFPKELNFQNYVDVDENLIAVDTSNSILDERNNLVKDDEPPCTDLPPTNAILNDLDDLRNWTVANSPTTDLNTLHQAISTIQAYCMKNLTSYPSRADKDNTDTPRSSICTSHLQQIPNQQRLLNRVLINAATAYDINVGSSDDASTTSYYTTTADNAHVTLPIQNSFGLTVPLSSSVTFVNPVMTSTSQHVNQNQVSYAIGQGGSLSLQELTSVYQQQQQNHQYFSH